MTNGLEILLHMGIDTVELNGAPFTIKVKEGDQVTADTVVAIADLEAIKAGKGTEMVVIITNMDKVAQFSLEKLAWLQLVHQLALPQPINELDRYFYKGISVFEHK